MSIRDIVTEVAREHRVAARDILSPNRFRNVTRARQEVMWRARQIKGPGDKPRYSYSVIGRVLDRDHATVIAGVRAHEERTANIHLQSGISGEQLRARPANPHTVAT